jgi:predicted dehydrogenase
VREPLVLHYRVNAGYLPATHWVQHPEEGGRLVGEGCHFIDLLCIWSDSPVRRVTARALPDGGRYVRDNFVVTLEFEDGSIGTVTYVAHGQRAAGKELLEVSGGGVCRASGRLPGAVPARPAGFAFPARLAQQDKGHRGEWEAFVAFLRAAGPTRCRSRHRAIDARDAGAARSLETGETVVLSDGR